MDDCKTRYPLLMVHGMGFRDRRYLNYWGRIPKLLSEHGATIFYGNQDSAGSIEHNAETVADSLLFALQSTGADKVNIIAHSKGGLESRLLVNMGFADKIASISTINTPHGGSLTVDKLMRMPQPLVRSAAKITDIWMRILGDKDPDAMTCFEEFTTSAAQRFNAENPIPEGILCQSFAFKMKSANSDITMCLPYSVVKRYDGDSDGLVSVQSAKWGNFRGVYTSAGRRGISHPDEVDIRRMHFTRATPKNKYEIADITEFYIELVKELKDNGY